jgi:type I restriction enzyme S subunit
MAMTELNDAHLTLVRRIVTRRLPGREVRIFGSRARGDAKPWSDLDLTVLDETPISDLALAEARADFEESDLPFGVDLVPWSDLPDSLRRVVRREGKRL